MIKNPLTYEIMVPQAVGVPANSLVLGKHSGRHALGKRCEQLGLQFTRQELDRVYKSFVAAADRNKVVPDEELLRITDREMPQGKPLENVCQPHTGGAAGMAD